MGFNLAFKWLKIKQYTSCTSFIVWRLHVSTLYRVIIRPSLESSVNAAYVFGIPTMLTNSRNITCLAIELHNTDVMLLDMSTRILFV